MINCELKTFLQIRPPFVKLDEVHFGPVKVVFFLFKLESVGHAREPPVENLFSQK